MKLARARLAVEDEECDVRSLRRSLRQPAPQKSCCGSKEHDHANDYCTEEEEHEEEE